jgi:hypothetical protein
VVEQLGLKVAVGQSSYHTHFLHDGGIYVYTEARYAARTWDHERRVVIKAEVVRLPGRTPRDNPRFVITNLRQSPRFVYERVYCARGDIENRIKELHDGLYTEDFVL